MVFYCFFVRFYVFDFTKKSPPYLPPTNKAFVVLCTEKPDRNIVLFESFKRVYSVLWLPLLPHCVLKLYTSFYQVMITVRFILCHLI